MSSSTRFVKNRGKSSVSSALVVVSRCKLGVGAVLERWI